MAFKFKTGVQTSPVVNFFKSNSLGFVALFSLSLSLTLSGCADTSIAPNIAESNPLFLHRWLALVGVIFLGIVNAGLATSGNAELAGEWFGEQTITALFSGVLMMTKLGELWFMFLQWLFGLWNPILAILGFFNGFVCNLGAAVIWIILLGFIFPTPDLFYWGVLPTLGGMGVRTLSLLGGNSDS